MLNNTTSGFSQILRKILKPRPVGRTDTIVSVDYVKDGDFLNAQGKWADAALCYEAALSQEPNRPEIWVQLGHCKKETGNQHEAVRAYKKALNIDPKHSDAAIHLAYLLRNIGDKQSAFIAFEYAFGLTGHELLQPELLSLIGSSSQYDEINKCMLELFDEGYYLDKYTDVRAASINPRVHYLIYGWKEGRNPNRFFDHNYYVLRYGSHIGHSQLPLVHYATQGRSHGFHCNHLAETLWFSPLAPGDQEWHNAKPAKVTQSNRAIVVLPVYRGYNETLNAILNVLKSRSNDNFGLVVVNDCSPDADLDLALSRLAELELFDYHRNNANLGFVRTINIAIEKFTLEKDVILLNSDAYVYEGWFSRLIAHADRDPSVATVTPMSNNATICSYPLNDSDNYLALELSPSELDKLAARVNAGQATEAFTGVGFCFYMRRDVINKIGGLDSGAFPVGYGEENDFCIRAIYAGYKNVIAHDVFVFHIGSVSFSLSREKNYRAGQEALLQKHPQFGRLVQQHLSSDPGLSFRRALDLERLAQLSGRFILFVTHRWSGGVETYLQGEFSQLSARGETYIVLRAHDRHLISVEVHSNDRLYFPNLSKIDLRMELPFLRILFQRLNLSIIHVNSLAGLEWQHHKAVLEAIYDSGQPYKIVIHDYSCVSHNYQLLRPDGLYDGAPTAQRLQIWDRMKLNGSPDLVLTSERQTLYKLFLDNAQEIIAPSQTAQSIVSSFFPSARITVQPHRNHISEFPALKRSNSNSRICIAVVGAIGPHKGSRILFELASAVKRRSLPLDIRLIGYSDIDSELMEVGVDISGPYKKEEEAAEGLRQFKADYLLIPSIWPETFCYTLSFAFQLGIEPIVFDFGAQGERVRLQKSGLLVPPEIINRSQELADLILAHAKNQPALLPLNT